MNTPFCIILCLAAALLAQAPNVEFHKLFNSSSVPAKTGDQADIYAHYVVETADHGFALAVRCCCSHCGNDFSLIKTDSAGNLVWSNRYDGPNGDDNPNCVQQTNDGGFIIAGQTNDQNALQDAFVVKTNSAGDQVWSNTYGNTGGYVWEQPYHIIQTTDGGFCFAGYVWDRNNSTGLDAYVVKLNAQGNAVWTKTYGGAREDWLRCVQQTADGGYILCGTTGSVTTGFGYDVWLVRLNGSGDTLWTRHFGGEDVNDGGMFLEITQDNGYIITGYANNYEDMYLVRTNSEGVLQWEKTYGADDTTSECSHAVKEIPGEGYIMGGYTAYNKPEPCIVRTDLQGNVLWRKTVPSGTWDYFYSIALTSDGGIVATGRQDQRTYAQLIKLDGR
ncbi:MAG: hypothetical protein A2487_10105 [Candidatus Raymondbacteria bacterium RifOxyC12_full_50_8]|uniref:Bulb-type lectin domain-containing protein n=1 Tax=Candidatus Raymondbacteria bacterium RIFOXYD12_FULL_49_13 TaxID=1817890 RepID=A0A1F7F7B7_UNCRA|nr:MAG: hypothetical protein A2248_00185 [Candidatus Raymondbacteria bacterium RIFOXYA2_FULL_49_16]OGJ96162.1 MAG: hypothetical protein A2453_05535 [Candidatus Raymondbacteria bacterium RIFOXYC2_FULL_50_21]OGJ99233.1 MAG: hypothetical protein A2487_10105 [Candidatus Raymondbacteria bacterium RifOxyC12_full_50_8]OGJ99685.1 MAG: hypothetical protein A2350_05655 [Candidatus Raymondbacteria bacterium RifOxyB12_full_50_8]OGK02417.1 MAG: hypothetical protein A2519_14460 [Candidatus Raymondbacteria ba